MKENKLLKISSIALIVGGAVALILDIVSFVGAYIMATLDNLGYDYTVFTDVMVTLLLIASISSFIGSFLEVITGITGLKFNKRPDKAKVCVIFGIIILALKIGTVVLEIIGGNVVNPSITIIYIIISIILPSLFLLGAIINRVGIMTALKEKYEMEKERLSGGTGSGKMS